MAVPETVSQARQALMGILNMGSGSEGVLAGRGVLQQAPADVHVPVCLAPSGVLEG